MLCDEGIIGPLKIPGLHADRLSFGFHCDGVFHAHVPFNVKLTLGDPVGEGRAVGQACGLFLRTEMVCPASDNPLKSPSCKLLARHGSTGVEQFRSPPLADNPGQDRASAHVTSCQADTGEKEGDLCIRGAVAEVGPHGQYRARTGTHAFHGGDDWLRAGAHRLDHITGHSSELQELFHVHVGKRPMISCTSPPEQCLPHR